MHIKELSLLNFRNYDSAELKFNENLNNNIIIAENGMGKSNLLEAIYYMSYVRPFRQVNDSDLVKKGEKLFNLSCSYEKNKIHGNININYDKTKNIKIDDKKISKHSEVLGKLLSVLFSNEDIFIISGTQSIRRRFFNMFFSVIDPLYLIYLKKYENLLKQKNALLKNKEKDLFYLFDEQLAEAVYYIQSFREQKIKEIDLIFSNSFNEIGFYNDKVNVKYSPSIKSDNLSKETILEKIEKNNRSDMIRGFSTIGSHKDDFLFYINKVQFVKYGSFGQIRLASLIIKYVQSVFYRNYFKTEPIFLLDDVILELDKERQKKFINFLGDKNQLFITVTDSNFPNIFFNRESINKIEVRNGKIL